MVKWLKVWMQGTAHLLKAEWNLCPVLGTQSGLSTPLKADGQQSRYAANV